MTATQQAAEARLAELDCAEVRNLLEQLVDLSKADEAFPVGHNAIYSSSVVLWLLVLQRARGGQSMQSAVQMLLEQMPSLLPSAHKRVREGTVSSRTGGYSVARQRLPVQSTIWLANSVAQSLIARTPPSWMGRRVYTIDGTTIPLPPTPALRKAFPPASNQYGPGTWPIAQLCVAHELASGAALVPEIAPMYGEAAVSETAMIDKVVRQLPEHSVVMADSGFGIFAVAHCIQTAGHDFVLRLTQQRFRAMVKRATCIQEDDHLRVYSLRWNASADDLRSHPELPRKAHLNVRLIALTCDNGETIYIVTTMTEDPELIAELYRRRYDAEIDIRNVKVALGTEKIHVRSVEMFMKELMMSFVTYNLTIEFRRQAAALARVPPRRLSYTGVLNVFRIRLLPHVYSTPSAWLDKYDEALKSAAQMVLPNRPNRSYKREAYHRTPKSNTFPKRRPPPLT